MSANLTSDATVREVLKTTGFVAPVKSDESVLKVLADSCDVDKMNEVTPICLADVDVETMKSWSGKKVVFHCDKFIACDCLFKGIMAYLFNGDVVLDTYKDTDFIIDFTGQFVYVHEEETAEFADWFIKVLE